MAVTPLDGWSHPDDASGTVSERTWRAIPRAKTYELVIDRIEEQILAGHLRIGDRLPAERDLAGMLGVSRSAVREAIRMLQAQGVLTSAVGNGPESGTFLAGSSSQALNRLLRLQVALTNFPIDQVVEARVMLERWSVRLAAAEATPQQLAHLHELLEQMNAPDIARHRFNELDTTFHVALAEAGGNRLVADLTGAIRESLRHILLDAFEQSPEWDKVANRLRAEHGEIHRCVAAHDGAGAADAVEAHIRTFFGGLEPPAAT